MSTHDDEFFLKANTKQRFLLEGRAGLSANERAILLPWLNAGGHGFTREKAALIVDLGAAGWSGYRITNETGIHHMFVWHELKAAGFRPREDCSTRVGMRGEAYVLEQLEKLNLAVTLTEHGSAFDLLVNGWLRVEAKTCAARPQFDGERLVNTLSFATDETRTSLGGRTSKKCYADDADFIAMVWLPPELEVARTWVLPTALLPKSDVRIKLGAKRRTKYAAFEGAWSLIVDAAHGPAGLPCAT